MRSRDDPQTVKQAFTFQNDIWLTIVTRVIDVKLSLVENAKIKVKHMHTWLIIPSKCVHQISETNVLVYCTDFNLLEKIRKH